jgi:hypothetical protein
LFENNMFENNNFNTSQKRYSLTYKLLFFVNYDFTFSKLS